MQTTHLRHMTHNLVFGLDHLATAVQAFLTDRQASSLSPNTILFYRNCLNRFIQFCESQAISRIDQITPDTIRLFLLWADRQGYNSGGKHALYRSVRAFLLWLESELDDYRAPTHKVKPPKLPKDIIEGVPLDDFQKMLTVCKGQNGLRDKALLLFLLDTGTRASETIAIDLNDVDFATGSVIIRKGKGSKTRVVYFGKTTRRAMITYLKNRKDNHPALWVNEHGERLTRFGLAKILQLRAKQAGLSSVPSPHDFRRSFALNMLRSGCDIFSLQRLMGHNDLTVLRRYLAQTENDLERVHRQHSPADNLKNR